MAKKLIDLRRDIMLGNFSDDEWMQIAQEVDTAMKNASEEEIQEFVDSGAGESLDMICSGISHAHQNK